MKIYIVTFKQIETNEFKLARLQAKNWSEATEKANDVIDFINKRYKKFNQQFELVKVESFEVIEEWEYQ